jgi:hypothetical protein
MKAPINLGLGVMADVCATPTGWVVTYRVLGGPLVVVWLSRDGVEQRRHLIDILNREDSTFPRLVTARARQFLAYRAWRAAAWWAVVRDVTGGTLAPEVLAGGVHPADHAYGNSPVCLSEDGWFAWQDADTMAVEGLSLATGEARTLRPEVRPTGLARCDGGVIVFVDDVRVTVRGMANPVVAHACTVGENLTGGIRVRMLDGRTGVLLSGDTFVPRVADGGDGTYAAVTWGSSGVLLVPFTPSELLDLPAPPAPAPTPIPVPPPKPEPTPVSTNMSPSVIDIVTRFVRVFPVPQKATPGNADDIFENICRGWILNLAEQIRFETNDPRWGTKNAGGGRPPSKDSITFNGDRLINYDMLGGVGTGRPTLVGTPAGEDITGQSFMPVHPADHLGGGVPSTPTTPTPTPTPAPTPQDLSALLARLDVLEASLRAEMRAQTDREVAKLDELKVALIKSVAEFKNALIQILPLILSGGGLGGLLGGIKK